MICTESGKQYILVLPVKIHCQMNYWMLDKHPSLKKQTDALLDTFCFFNFDTHYFHGVVFILLTPLKIRSYGMDKVFLCTFIIYFFKSLSYKVHTKYHEYIIIYIIFTIYHDFLQGTMYLAIKNLMSRYSGTLCMKIHLFKITKYFAHYICSFVICVPSNYLKTQCARILKVKRKMPRLIYSVEL